MAEDSYPDATKSVASGLTPEEQKKRGQRNLALALSLLAFIVIVFLVTILRLGGTVAERIS